MKRWLQKITSIVAVCCLMFALMLSVIGAGMSVNNSGVNFRSAPSLEAQVIRTLDAGTAVEVLEHNPASWSKVKVNGTAGYIKSEYLTIPSGAGNVAFKTTDGVNFRTGPSTDSDIIRALVTNSEVKMVEHDPAGWSKVKFNDTTGYIKSEFLTLTPGTASTAATSGTENTTLKTIDGVNFRSGPSTDSDVIKTLSANTAVQVIERDPAGWSKVKVDGTVGYIKSDLLSATGRTVELLDWATVRGILKNGVPIPTIDVRTGRTYTIQCFSRGDHADVEPLTQADTDTMFDIRGGVWSWAARPVWVSIDGRLIAASLHGMPHDVSTISNNGMNGHLCLHFLGSTTSSTSESYKKDLQNAVQEAWNAR